MHKNTRRSTTSATATMTVVTMTHRRTRYSWRRYGLSLAAWHCQRLLSALINWFWRWSVREAHQVLWEQVWYVDNFKWFQRHLSDVLKNFQIGLVFVGVKGIAKMVYKQKKSWEEENKSIQDYKANKCWRYGQEWNIRNIYYQSQIHIHNKNNIENRSQVAILYRIVRSVPF